MLIDKPSGWTSHDAVAVVRRQLGLRAVGHAGTLDPFATGLLVIFVGRATRLARFVEGCAKRYHATFHLGVATDTEDGTGQVLSTVTPSTWPSREQVEALLGEFVGTSMQVPPTYSAKHVGGTRSYRLARAGQPVALPPVEVVMHSLVLTEFVPPRMTIDASVGKGTYIRSLARDVGDRLGIPAHCVELRRTEVGPFSVREAVPPEAVDPGRLLSPTAMLAHLPQVMLNADDVKNIGFGRAVTRGDVGSEEGPVALIAADGRLVAVAEGREEMWHPTVVIEVAE